YVNWSSSCRLSDPWRAARSREPRRSPWARHFAFTTARSTKATRRDPKSYAVITGSSSQKPNGCGGRKRHEPLASPARCRPAGRPTRRTGDSRLGLSLARTPVALPVVAVGRVHGVGILPGLALATPAKAIADARWHAPDALDRTRPASLEAGREPGGSGGE